MFRSNCFIVTRGKQEGEVGENVNSLKPLALIRAELSRRSERLKVRRKQTKNSMRLSFS